MPIRSARDVMFDSHFILVGSSELLRKWSMKRKYISHFTHRRVAHFIWLHKSVFSSIYTQREISNLRYDLELGKKNELSNKIFQHFNIIFSLSIDQSLSKKQLVRHLFQAIFLFFLFFQCNVNKFSRLIAIVCIWYSCLHFIERQTGAGKHRYVIIIHAMCDSFLRIHQ